MLDDGGIAQKTWWRLLVTKGGQGTGEKKERRGQEEARTKAQSLIGKVQAMGPLTMAGWLSVVGRWSTIDDDDDERGRASGSSSSGSCSR